MKRIYRNDVSNMTKEKQSVAHRGKNHTNETKQKISKAMQDYWAKLPTKPINNNNSTSTIGKIYGRD